MRLKLAYITNLGRLRHRNEDALLVADRLIAGISMEKVQAEELELNGQALFAVADGMGGMPCGDRASGLVLESLKGSQVTDRGELIELLKRVKGSLDRYVQTAGECYGMGTALAGVFLEKERALVFNVGDCRVYRLREGLEMLTRDHTEAYELYEKGYIDKESVRHHPLRNMLTSAIMGGYQEDFEVHVVDTDVLPGDSFLVCSDGLWDELPEAGIEARMGLGIEEAGSCLFEEAYRGGRDNISFILLRVP